MILKKNILIKLSCVVIVLTLLSFIGINCKYKYFHPNQKYFIGEIIDSYNGVSVFYNGNAGNVFERNLSEDGYNLGLKYQCVEFIKRYYFETFDHKMPNSWGNAVDFFDVKLSDGQFNSERGLNQYRNPSNKKPEVNDILVYKGNIGHVSIITNITGNKIEIIQQNPGRFGKSREKLDLKNVNGLWEIKNTKILGWLRKE